jgi:peroxiredoxin
VLVAALGIATALVVMLTLRVQSVSRSYQRLAFLSARPHAGIAVPTFQASTLEGNSVTVGEIRDSAPAQVLFVFDTKCPYCRQTIPVWKRIADSLGRLPRPPQVLGVSLDSLEVTEMYAKEHALPYPVVRFPLRKLARLYRATTIPVTMVLDYQGTVVFAHTGLLDQPAVLDSVYGAVSRARRDTVLIAGRGPEPRSLP